ncbi:MAG TPA: NUDIX domain-containing protein [Actinospica sp.]|jgi:8-oxo-dGTP pyrophosphatase MutT (NUDIX family)|nr:NUDIX domain-containing protein [Actinospica sp.]
MINYESVAGSTVCICAPTRASTEVADLERRLGLAGASVLAPVPPGGQLSEYERAALTTLHQRKIKAADLVVVANASGYTGIGTCEEIAYALRLGKPVTFLQDPVEVEIDPAGYSGLVSRDARALLHAEDKVGAQLNSGAVVSVRAPSDGTERAAWLRVTEVRRFADRAQALAAIDPARVRPGTDRAGLAAWMDQQHPGTGADAHLVVELDFIAELHDVPHPIEQPGAAYVSLLTRDRDGRVLLARDSGSQQEWHLARRDVVDGDDLLAAAIELARDIHGRPDAVPVLVALDYTTAGGHHRIAEYVFATAEPHHQAPAQARFTAPEDIKALVSPRAARVISAALAQLGRPGAAVCEHGYGPEQRITWQWHEQAQPPTGVPVTQAGVWAFDKDGRVLLQYREARRAFALPAGSTEPEDRDQLASAAREAFEESQVVIDQHRAVLLGYQVTYGDPRFPNGLAQARYAAPILAYHPAGEDTDPKLTGRRPAYRRYLVDVRRAAALLDYGPHAEAQARAAEQAAREIGIPVDRPAADGYRDYGDPGIEPAQGWELTL